MTDSFRASIEGYRDWLPYSGKRKGASPNRQYAMAAEQLAGWAREQGRRGVSVPVFAFLLGWADRAGHPVAQAPRVASSQTAGASSQA